MLLLAGDAALRSATQTFLTIEGYSVTPAATLVDAVELAWHSREFGFLMVNDPASDGLMAGRAVIALRHIIGPGLRAVLVTGEVSSDLRAFSRDPLVRLATSPVDADTLAAKMQSLLPECQITS